MENYVPRPEFELMCKSVNGSLFRIEAAVKDVNLKLDALGEADNQRTTWDAHNKQVAECKETLGKLQGRPSWAITAIIGALGTGLATTLTLLLTGVIK